ncbi:hypothetical protein CAPTEDRAFT_91261 [Capitella teleta]|uniref:Peroxin-7 n=1 Tax=Capitella teleta TaxID=283909 RepID=R7UK09_CAPTE|nr:hypothetical protein CAPTEDRAFT_91261 [Capitella teleta]|eukprot:ELU03607.1 hypothetical protein CAPTEDRAFT_91261 [Capitella teleta]
MISPPAMFRTPGRHGYGVQFHPFSHQRIACATSQHFGIAGAGTVFVLDHTPQGLNLVRAWEWKEGLFDVTWSEANPNILVTGSGDGSLQVWDTDSPTQEPAKILQEHTKEVYGINWSLRRDAQSIVSASWDTTLKMWDVNRSQSLVTLTGHEAVVYAGIWSPFMTGCLASASGDGTLRIWDIKKPYAAAVVIPASKGEILTCDWCRYHPNLVFSGAVDGSVLGWDLRNPRQPVCHLRGHKYAVKRIKCSPFEGNILVTCSYDFTVKTWDMKDPSCAPRETIEHHTEFVYGVDFNLHVPGQIADCSWDETIKVYNPASLQAVTPVPS